MSSEKPMTVEEYWYSQADEKKAKAIVRPTIEAESYEINPIIIQIIKEDYQFEGNVDQDPYDHISDFLDICNTFKLRDVSEDAVRLLLFPFSLRNKAKNWLRSLPGNSITTWDQLEHKFLRNFYPMMDNNYDKQPQPRFDVKKKKKLLELLKEYIADQERRNDQVDDYIKDLQASMHHLEKQVGRMLSEGGFEERYQYYNYS